MRFTPAVFLLLACLLVVQFQNCLSEPAPDHQGRPDHHTRPSHEDKELSSLIESKDGENFEEDDEGAESNGNLLETQEEDEEDEEVNEDEEDEDPDEPTDEEGEPPGDHPLNPNRRRGVYDEEALDVTTPPPVAEEEEEEFTTTTTPYPLGIIGPGEDAVDPEHYQEIGPIKPWPKGAEKKWARQIAAHDAKPGAGVKPINECSGRRRQDRRRETCKASYRRRRRSDIYEHRAFSECEEETSERRRRICEQTGTRRRRARRRDASLARRRRVRRRRIEKQAKQKGTPTGSDPGSSSLQQIHEYGKSTHEKIDSSVADGFRQTYPSDTWPSASESPAEVDTGMVPGFASLSSKFSLNSSEFDHAFKSMSGEVGNLLDQSSAVLKQLDETLNFSKNSNSAAQLDESSNFTKSSSSLPQLGETLNFTKSSSSLPQLDETLNFTKSSSSAMSTRGPEQKLLATPDKLTADAALLRRHSD